MFWRLRTRLTYANVVATLALVFAMSGGALAASKYLITSTKQIKPSVLASLKGKAGASGAQGPAGPAGKEGPVGKEGLAGKGETGKEGPEGKAGANGESVASKAIVANSKNVNCKEGGSQFESEPAKGKVKTYACNGSPWTVGGTLPPEKTETGTWAFDGGEDSFFASASISFPIRLSKGIEGSHIHFLKAGEKGAEGGGCGGGSTENPTAEPGNLCIYTLSLNKVYAEKSGKFVEEETPSGYLDPESGGGFAAGTTGVGIDFLTPEKQESEGWGDWAVTEEKEG